MSILSSSLGNIDTSLHYLAFLHGLCYFSNMVLADFLFPNQIDLFAYALLKYVIGYAFYIVFPIIVISMKSEFREEMRKVYKENSGARTELSQEEKLQEIGKEMLNMSSY